MELVDIRTRFTDFLAGKVSRDDVDFWIADQVMTPSETRNTESDFTDSRSEARVLAYLIGESFCSLHRDEEEARLFATRVLACVDQILEPNAIVDILPLLRQHEDFSVLVSKYARGLISRAGFRSIVKKRFAFDEVRPWLENASNDQLAALMNTIEASDFRRARSLLSLPAV
jgi:hypothetical protein